MLCCYRLQDRNILIRTLWVLSQGSEKRKRSPWTDVGKGMCLLMVSAVSSRNQDCPFICWNLTEFISVGICQCLSPMNRSNLNSFGRRRSFLVLGPTDSQRLCSCGATETKRCCWSPAAQPPAGTAHGLHTLLASPVSLVGELFWPRMQISSLSHKRRGFGMTLPQQRVPRREDSSLMPFGMDFNSFWDLARDSDPYHLHLYPSWRLNCLTNSMQFLKSGKFTELETH